MHDGRDDFVHGMGEDDSEIELDELREEPREEPRTEPRETLRPETRAAVREHVRTLRHGSAETSSELVVTQAASEARVGCVEMQENARHSGGAHASAHRATEDDALPTPGSAEAAFEARCKPLTSRQLTAIGLIVMGKTIVATARTLKVDPATVHRWKSSHPLFIAELGRRQAAMFDATVTKLRLTMERAVDELHAIVTGPSKRERAEATWRLLPMLRPARLIVPTGPVSATGVIDAEIRAGRKERGEVVEGEITLEERLAQVPREFLAEPAT